MGEILSYISGILPHCKDLPGSSQKEYKINRFRRYINAKFCHSRKM